MSKADNIYRHLNRERLERERLEAEAARLAGPTQDEIDQQWPGFTVTCKACGSTKIELEDSLGYSDMSGTWGGVSLTCLVCKATTNIVEG